jgi:adenylate cyclase
MTEAFVKDDGNSELWHTIFALGHPDLSAQREFHARLPRDPRCKLCKAPFAGIGGLYMRFRGKGASSRNKNYCNACDVFLETFPGGAEVEMSILFADIRNSTAFAETAGPKAASDRVNRFLDTATAIITENDGFILAFYGDCIVAVWPPGFSGPGHAASAVAAGREIARSLGTGADTVPVGVGVHMGSVFIGTVQAAKGLFRDVSIFGVEVNVTARLAASAAAGETLASLEILEAAKADTGAEMRCLELKGISRPVRASALN